MTQPETGTVPLYYLYGERDADVDLDFLHVEPIPDRSGPNAWQIGAHAHPDHMQLILIREGGGIVRLEDRDHPLPAPCLIVLPAGCVHRFRFDPGTDGHVVTAALGFLDEAAGRDTDLGGAVARPAVLALADCGMDIAAIGDIFERLLREFIWSAPGRRAAIAAFFTQLLVIVLRLRVTQSQSAQGPAMSRDQDLLMRYRALIERNFRNAHAPAFYADALAVTTARLNAACKARTGRTASQILHERILLEARRYLLYTDNSVAQIAHLTGFDDPAYFNRFFTRRSSVPPGQYRRQGRQG